ncbi:hypothetical protein [Sinorhizobium alkalisoli]|uniref:Growth inhibitor PemK n=1 Tax=Sinorhizobium alkalisoli TaxID=1752398 RepID=A0A1E3V4T1_9HYPH|nr:hypothetical protein [Sinorhizobium alkalisoli]MCG5481187.1 hypothetical protein [Sinorhizobium alkalisoli]ODR88642.1 hypothetical protein A8M32_24525 [Sinorhizobium alkalisoli]
MTNSFDDGEIVEYEYLWEWQAQKGRTNAEKDRPVCLAMVIRDDEQGLTHLIILPISGTPPRPDQDAMAIPALELRRAGLSDFKSGWITVSEYNYDVLERSFYFDSNQKPRGRFSGPFMDQILMRFRRHLVQKRGRIDRTR